MEVEIGLCPSHNAHSDFTQDFEGNLSASFLTRESYLSRNPSLLKVYTNSPSMNQSEHVLRSTIASPGQRRAGGGRGTGVSPTGLPRLLSNGTGRSD